MTSHSPASAQIVAEHVSLTPQIFRSAPPQKHGPDFGISPLLQDLSFQVFPGERVAIVGASGAGKTTLLRVLNRLSEPTTGTLYLNGQPYAKIPVGQLRQQVVLVLQETKLLGMTVQDALAYPLQLRGVSKQVAQQRMSEWLDRLQIPLEWLSRTEQQLSVGQRQLVAIARALVLQPPVLLLDEPTSALDVGRTQQVLNILTELSETQPTTIVMVNHQLEVARKFATRVLQLDQGQLISDRPSNQIDWTALEQALQLSETQQTAEWE